MNPGLHGHRQAMNNLFALREWLCLWCFQNDEKLPDCTRFFPVRKQLHSLISRRFKDAYFFPGGRKKRAISHRLSISVAFACPLYQSDRKERSHCICNYYKYIERGEVLRLQAKLKLNFPMF